MKAALPSSVVSAAQAAGLNLAQFTNSERVIAQLQAQYGTMQPGRLQALRKQFYSYVAYPLTGSVQLNFFGQAVGNNGVTLEETNMPVQGSFGTSAMLVKGVMCNYKITAENTAAYNGLDATTIVTEMLGGIFTAGVFNLDVNAKNYLQVSQPFMQMPPADGRTRNISSGQISVDTGAEPSVNLSSRSENRFIVDPEIFIAAQQNFSCSISFPAGAIPVRATSIITAEVPLYVGVILDGIEFRPVQ